MNKRKHGLNLVDGIPALEDPDRDISIDDRFDYEEVRIVTAGRSGAKILVVVSTELGSMPKAKKSRGSSR